jgi:hypothetical protein
MIVGQRSPLDPAAAYAELVARLDTRIGDVERSAQRGAPIAYTPTIGGTGWALGSGVIEGWWRRRGLVDVIIDFELDTTTAGSAPLTFTLPDGITVATDQWFPGMIDDAGVRIPLWCLASGSTITPFPATSVTQLDNDGLQAGSPITWATGDTVHITATGIRPA